MAAETKRQSVGGKGSGAPAVNLGPSGMVPLETALSGAIGARCAKDLFHCFPKSQLTFLFAIGFALPPLPPHPTPLRELFSPLAQSRT